MHGDLILFVKAITPNPGGVESYSDSVAQAWAELGFNVTVVTQFDGPVGVSRRGPVIVINVGPGSQLGVFWRMFKVASELKKTLKPRLIHATTWRVAIPALLVFPDTRIAVTVHGREVTETTGWMKSLMNGVFERIDKALVISESSLDQCIPLIPILRHKYVVSWNGLTYADEARQHPKDWSANPDRPFRLYSLCRLVERKNIAGVLAALSISRATGTVDWEYIIAGDGEDRAMLEELSKTLMLDDKVKFLGRVADEDIGRLYREADLFVHPQTSGPDGRDIEGFGLVIVDAMSFGTPVLVGLDGAPREYLEDEKTAFLVDGNDISDIEVSIRARKDNREQLQKVGEAGREWALSTLTWKGHVERLWLKMCDDELP